MGFGGVDFVSGCLASISTRASFDQRPVFISKLAVSVVVLWKSGDSVKSIDLYRSDMDVVLKGSGIGGRRSGMEFRFRVTVFGLAES